ncbi:hypothetical protein T07_5266 [Trichinella nelsoni]|uniref:Uncharacterized protein n=1 Tax=Trichinella nelsoni TaxID=6336 RepID=A0A0V0SBH1_9BILA|nr:hypothetical protein T07_5266 [Trichinella nelsoni]
MKDMTSPSIFTFNIKKCYKYVLWKLNDYILKICQISKKGIYYSSIQGHILYSHTSPSPVKLNRGMQKLFETCCKFQGSLELQMNRNSLGLNLKVDWNTLLCLKTSGKQSRVIYSVAWGVACGYLSENLRIFWDLRKFLPEA